MCVNNGTLSATATVSDTPCFSRRTAVSLITDGAPVKQGKEINKVPVKRRSRGLDPRGLVIGSNEERANIKSAPRLSEIHVCRLDKDTTCDELLEYLKDKCSIVGCERLNSKQPTVYSSFKISASYDSVRVLLDPATWPRGVAVRKFFQRRFAVEDSR